MRMSGERAAGSSRKTAVVVQGPRSVEEVGASRTLITQYLPRPWGPMGNC